MKRIAIAMATTALIAVPAMAQSTSTPPSSNPPSSMSTPSTPPSGSTSNTGSSNMNSSGSMNKADTSKSTASTASASGTFLDKQGQDEWRASKLIGTKVMGPDDKSIGDVNELILDKDGNVHGVVLGVGGFLGIGEKVVAVPFKALTVQRDQKGTGIEKISATFTKDQLKNAPDYKYLADKSSNETTASGSATTTPKRGAGAPATSR